MQEAKSAGGVSKQKYRVTQPIIIADSEPAKKESAKNQNESKLSRVSPSPNNNDSSYPLTLSKNFKNKSKS